MNGRLVLLRHGQSTANAAGIFTGLLDVPLTATGEQQALLAGALLRAHGVIPDLVLTSMLQRSVRTAELVTEAIGRDIAVESAWQLNERNYGALTGHSKHAAQTTLGEVAFTRIRRSLNGQPPRMPLRQWWALRRSRALRDLPWSAVRRTETLSDVIDRVRPVLTGRIMPALAAGSTVLVVAHGNSLRAVCAVIDGLSEVELAGLNLPTGQPLLYRLEEDCVFRPRGGTYLDPTALTAAALVAAEGGT